MQGVDEMQDYRTWSWAFLGLFMISLHLPAFSARSIRWTEETNLQDLGSDSRLSGYPSLADPLGPFIPDHPWLKLDPLSDGSETIVPLGPDDSLFDHSWQSGNSGLQGSPLDSGASSAQVSDDTWQMMAHPYDDSLPDSPSHSLGVMPSMASGSQTVVTPPGSDSVSSSPGTPSFLKDTEPKRPPRSDLLGPQEEIPTQRSSWSLNNRIRQKPLPGHPWGTQHINPVVSWGSQGLGTGWGGRPFRLPVGGWGISNQYPGTSWGINTRYPGTSWGVNNWYPSINWGGNNGYPGNSWGRLNQYPGTNNQSPGNTWGINNRYPGALRLPSSSWNVPPRYQNHP